MHGAASIAGRGRGDEPVERKSGRLADKDGGDSDRIGRGGLMSGLSRGPPGLGDFCESRKALADIDLSLPRRDCVSGLRQREALGEKGAESATDSAVDCIRSTTFVLSGRTTFVVSEVDGAMPEGEAGGVKTRRRARGEPCGLGDVGVLGTVIVIGPLRDRGTKPCGLGDVGVLGTVIVIGPARDRGDESLARGTIL